MNNVTLIDDLPNLDDLEPTTPVNINSGFEMIPDPGRYKKFIRNSGMATPIESGMQINTPKPNYPPLKNNKIQKDVENLFPEYHIQGEYKPYVPSTYENFDVRVNPSYSKKVNDEDITCVHVAHHTENCTVCSKLYSNNNMVFIFVIIFQAIIILLLIKKILE